MGFIRSQLNKTLYINHKQSIYVILYMNNIKAIKLNNDYLNKINRLFKNKYIIFDATHSN